MKRIKALMYGVGVVAKTEMVKLMVEKGVDVVGAVSKSQNIGKDLGEVCGIGHPLGVKITNDAEPGFITCEKLPKLRYRTYPLHYYVKQA